MCIGVFSEYDSSVSGEVSIGLADDRRYSKPKQWDHLTEWELGQGGICERTGVGTGRDLREDGSWDNARVGRTETPVFLSIIDQGDPVDEYFK